MKPIKNWIFNEPDILNYYRSCHHHHTHNQNPNFWFRMWCSIVSATACLDIIIIFLHFREYNIEQQQHQKMLSIIIFGHDSHKSRFIGDRFHRKYTSFVLQLMHYWYYFMAKFIAFTKQTLQMHLYADDHVVCIRYLFEC